MGKDIKGIFSFVVTIATTCLLLGYVIQDKTKQEPPTTPPKIRAVPIGYNLGKVGKDSVLTIKGQFVRQVGDRVYVKVK